MALTVLGNTGISSVPSSLLTGPLPAARFPAALPALNGASVTNINANNIASGTVPVARLGSGANTTTFLRGDGTFQVAGGVTELISTVTAQESDSASYFTFNPASGWFDNTYTSLWIEGDMIRSDTNNVYMRYQLSTADSGGSHTFQTTTSIYRYSGLVRKNTSNQNKGLSSNNLNITAGDPNSYGFDTLANMYAMGRFYIDLGWFAQTSVAGVNKTTAATTAGGRPIIRAYTYTSPNNTSSDVNWTTVVSTLNKSVSGITDATKWSGIRFYMSSGDMSGEMRLWGRKQ